jgi:acetoin utilization protein AcuB
MPTEPLRERGHHSVSTVPAVTNSAHHLTVGDFMTTEPCTVAEDLTLADAEDRMQSNNIRHLLVAKEGRIVGLLSSRDVSFASGWKHVNSRKLTVSDAMSPKVFTCRPTDPLEDVALEMESHRYGCAVVIENDVAVGIFTTTDALRALRQALLGHPVQAAVNPTHRPSVGQARDVVEHHTRVGSMLVTHHAGPQARHGLIG